jgi:hypothetical protein
LLTQRPQWQALAAHASALATRQLRELFAEDPQRGQRLHAEGAGLYLDYSRQRVDDDTLRLLLAPKTARRCTSRCGCRRIRSWRSTASMS